MSKTVNTNGEFCERWELNIEGERFLISGFCAKISGARSRLYRMPYRHDYEILKLVDL